MNYLITLEQLTHKKGFPFLVLLFILNCISLISTAQLKRFTFSEQKMGATFSLIFYDSDSTHAKNIAKNAFLIADSLNNSFSDYLPNSEISEICKTTGNGKFTKISKYLFEILTISKAAYVKSEGMFDVTIGKLSKLWRKTRKEKKMPEKSILTSALKTVNMNFLKINVKDSTLNIAKKGLEIDLGGIGKGFAAEKILKYLVTENIKIALVDAAGNMAIGDAPPNKKGWNIAIELPNENRDLVQKMLNLSAMAVSTSGDAYQNVEIEGKKYSHILNPKTGLGITNGRQATIICKNATKADWLSTACCILSIKKALNLAKKEKAELFIAETKANKIKYYYSKGFKKLLNN